MAINDDNLGQKAARTGAAVFALGLMLAGPQAAGVASADSGEDSSATSASAADSNPAAPTGRAGRGVARSATAPATGRAAGPSRSRATAPEGTASPSAAQRTPRAASAVSAPPRRGSGGGRTAAVPAPISDAQAAVSAPAPEPVAAPVGRGAVLPSAAVVSPTAGQGSAGAAARPSAAVLSPGLGTPKLPAWAAAAHANAASAKAPVLTALTNAVNRVFDNVANLLSRFPSGPINDLVSGALLLTRRVLSLIEPAPASAPVATSVWLPNAGTYGTDAKMDFVVNFDQRVVVTNANVALPVEINYILANAKYVSGSGTGSLLFRLDAPAEEWDPNGIDLGVVSSQTGIRVFDFGDRIKAKKTGLAASNTIPTVNTSRVAVDSMGPQIAGRSDLQVSGSNVTLTVTFDRPVIVTGTPTVPVVVDGVNTELSYVRGNRTDTLTFRLNNPSGVAVKAAAFNPFVGDVIYLSPTAGIRDRTGSQIYTLEGDIDTPLIENGNHVVVIGHHFEKLQSWKKKDLDAILSDENRGAFWYESTIGPPFYSGKENPLYAPFPVPTGVEKPPYVNWPFDRPYVLPTAPAAQYGVDVFRVAFRSWIPEQGRYTTAYGLAALPVNQEPVYGILTPKKGAVPVVEWQQPTVFNLTNSAPSQAFSCGAVPTCDRQLENVPPRVEVAQFGGQGYAVFIPDPFGLGNSPDRYAYQLVGSAAQWSTDMLKAGQALLAAREMQQSHLFLGGWSAAGNETSAFLESLQTQGQKVSGTVIASSPMALNATVTNGIFGKPLEGPRVYTPESTGNAVWLNVAVGFSSISEGGYSGQPTAGLDLLGKYYEAARRLYTMQYEEVKFGSAMPNDPFDANSLGVQVYYRDVDGQRQMAFMPYNLRELIVPQYSASREAFQESAYAKLMTANSTGNKLWTSPVMLNYGQQDEVMPPEFGRLVYDKQLELGNQTITFNEVLSANHRGTYLRAVANAVEWFSSIAGFIITDGLIIETPTPS